MKNGLWRWWIQFFLLGVYFLPASVLQIRHPSATPALGTSTAGLLWVCGAQILLFSVVFLLACFFTRPTREDLLLHWHWSAAPLGAGYSLLFRVALAIIAIAVVLGAMATGLLDAEKVRHVAQANAPRVDRLVSVGALQHDRAYFLLTVTLVSFVVAGGREEFWRVGLLASMRHLWPRAFASERGQYLAVAVIAIGFGAAHFPQGFAATILAGILGLFLGGVMVYHRSVWPAIFAHGFFDATTFALIPLFHAQLGR